MTHKLPALSVHQHTLTKLDVIQGIFNITLLVLNTFYHNKLGPALRPEIIYI